MTIHSQMNLADYVNANLAFRYSRIGTKIVTAIGILFAVVVVYFTIVYPEGVDFTMYIAPAILIFLPLVSNYFMVRLNYKSNTRMGELMEYIFSDDYLSIKGESFSTQFTWEKIYKVTQTSNWIFIWQNRQNANPIAKKNFTESEITELKTILDFHQVKHNL
ncbi:MAG TPA: YcxB family protein [Puia sp.]|nr:YcxB family protein [Puia sp.]